MTTRTDYLRLVAEMGLQAFRQDTRPDGSTYWHTNDVRPAWLDDIVYHAHGEILPDDFIYQSLQAAFVWLVEALDHASYEGDVPDPMDFADAHTDAYNADLAAWLASHVLRGSFVDEAREEYGNDLDASIWTLIARGQHMELQRIAAVVIEGVEQRADEEEKRLR